MLIIKAPVTHQDKPFLFALYTETRANELNFVPWEEAQKTAFLQQQFQLQHHHYTTNYKNACFQVIKSDEKPIGRLYVGLRYFWNRKRRSSHNNLSKFL